MTNDEIPNDEIPNDEKTETAASLQTITWPFVVKLYEE